jgi:hypothetical protein
MNRQVAFDRYLLGSTYPSVSRYNNDAVQLLWVCSEPQNIYLLYINIMIYVHI